MERNLGIYLIKEMEPAGGLGMKLIVFWFGMNFTIYCMVLLISPSMKNSIYLCRKWQGNKTYKPLEVVLNIAGEITVFNVRI